MRVSVIVPVYNTEKYLRKCVDSLCRQTHTDLQIILVNDGSEDDSLKVMYELKEQDERICIVDKEHSGLSATKNAGLEVVTGDYVSFIDSDDWVDINMYEIMLRQIEENQLDAAYCEWTEEYSDGTFDIKGRKGTKRILLEGEGILDKYFRNEIHLRSSSSLVSWDIIKQLRFDTNLQPGEEMYFGFQVLCRANRVIYADMPFYHRYHRVGSISNKRGFQPLDLRKLTSVEMMVRDIEESKKQYLQKAYAFCFTMHLTILNRMVYHMAQREYKNIYDQILKRMNELLSLLEKPKMDMSLQAYYAYMLFRTSKPIYYIVVKIYYKYIKKEFDGKRQK